LPAPAHGWSSVPGPLESFGQSVRGGRAADGVGGVGAALALIVVVALILGGAVADAGALVEGAGAAPSEQAESAARVDDRASQRCAKRMAREAIPSALSR